jgi:AraC-like DNA-binding protein
LAHGWQYSTGNVHRPKQQSLNLGLGVKAQGNKQLLLGGEVIKCGPGQSVRTSIAVPVVSHVTRTTAEKLMLGFLLTLDGQDVIQMVADMQLTAPQRQTPFRSISIEPMEVGALAAHIHMSASTLRKHIRAITGTSPVQYQKQLRLQEAQQLMLNQGVDTSGASGLVGYESALAQLRRIQPHSVSINAPAPFVGLRRSQGTYSALPQTCLFLKGSI